MDTKTCPRCERNLERNLDNFIPGKCRGGVGAYCRECHYQYRDEMRRKVSAERRPKFWDKLKPKWHALPEEYQKRLRKRVARLARLKGFDYLAEDAAQFACIWASQYGREKTNPRFVLTEFLRLELGEPESQKRLAKFADLADWRIYFDNPSGRIDSD